MLLSGAAVSVFALQQEGLGFTPGLDTHLPG